MKCEKIVFARTPLKLHSAKYYLTFMDEYWPHQFCKNMHLNFIFVSGFYLIGNGEYVE